MFKRIINLAEGLENLRAQWHVSNCDFHRARVNKTERYLRIESESFFSLSEFDSPETLFITTLIKVSDEKCARVGGIEAENRKNEPTSKRFLLSLVAGEKCFSSVSIGGLSSAGPMYLLG